MPQDTMWFGTQAAGTRAAEYTYVHTDGDDLDQTVSE